MTVRSYPITFDATLVATFTITLDNDNLEELVHVTRDRENDAWEVWVESPQGQATRRIFVMHGERAGDMAMSHALRHCGWGGLLLTEELDNEEG